MKIATTKNTFFPPHNFFPHLFLSIFSSQPKLKQRFREKYVYHYGGRVVLPRFLSAWVSLQPREWRWEPIPSICVSVCVCVCAWGWVLFYRWMSILCNESHPRGHCNIVLKEGKLLTVVLRFCVHTKHNMLQPRKEVCTLLPIARVWIDGMTTTGPKHLPLTKWPAIAKNAEHESASEIGKCEIEECWVLNLIFSSKVGRVDDKLSFSRQGGPQFKD